MKKVLIFSIFLCALLVVFPCSPSKAYQMDLSNLTDSQLEDIGSLAMGYMITNGDAEELDFSNGDQDVGFLKALGLTIVTEDPTYIIGYGLNWADQKAAALLQTCKDWVEENLTWLYDAWYGTEHKIQYHSPGTHRFSQNFKELLKDRVTSPDPVTPEPDVNYIEYIQLINGNTFNIRGVQADFWLSNYNRQTSNTTGSTTFDADPNKFTFLKTSFDYNLSHYNSSDSLCIYRNNQYEIHNTFVSEPVTIYINQVPNSNNYIVTTSVFDLKKPFYWSGLTFFDGHAYYSNGTYSFGGGANQYYPSINNFQYTGTLENCFKIICINFRNVDIYVNGDIWSLGHFTTDDSIIYPIGIPDSFEVLGGGVQGQYNYPSETYWDLDGLRALIKQAIEDADVVTYTDIAPLIVDVNGQQAVATVNVHRTDYDLMVDEQYMIHPNGNNVFVVPDLSDYTDVTSMIATEGGTSLIPSDIKVVLGAFGIILLVGYLINRMLE